MNALAVTKYLKVRKKISFVYERTFITVNYNRLIIDRYYHCLPLHCVHASDNNKNLTGTNEIYYYKCDIRPCINIILQSTTDIVGSLPYNYLHDKKRLNYIHSHLCSDHTCLRSMSMGAEGYKTTQLEKPAKPVRPTATTR